MVKYVNLFKTYGVFHSGRNYVKVFILLVLVTGGNKVNSIYLKVEVGLQIEGSLTTTTTITTLRTTKGKSNKNFEHCLKP